MSKGSDMFSSIYGNFSVDFENSEVNKAQKKAKQDLENAQRNMASQANKLAADLRGVYDGTKAHGKDGFLDAYARAAHEGKNRDLVGQFTNAFDKDYGASREERAYNMLTEIRGLVNTASSVSSADLLTELQSISMGQLNRVANDLVQRHKKEIDNVKKVWNTGAKWANALGIKWNGHSIGSFDSVTDIGIQRVKTYFAPNSIDKMLTPNLEKVMETTDPVSLDIDLNDILKIYIEDCGYVMDKWRSIRFARDYCFVQRPALESDTGGYHRTYAWFTRPNLNLMEFDTGGSLNLNPDMIRYPDLLQMVHRDAMLYAELCRDGASKSNIFMMLSNYIKEIPPVKLAESNREGVMNMYGKSTPIPGIPEIYGEVDIPVTFIDNDRGDIAHLLYMLSMYKTYVGKEGFAMRPDYVQYGGVDYLMSLYVCHVNVNWEVVGFGVFIGCMISDPPTHFTQHRMDGFGKPEIMDDFTVNFRAATYIPMAPHYFDIFNCLTEFNPGSLVDTRGSSSTLQATGRMPDPSPRDRATSVFHSDFPGYTPGGNSRGTTNRRVDPGYRHVDFANATYEGNRSIKIGSTTTTEINGEMPHTDTFEFIARAPGIYTAVNANEPHRTIFKLGFSY